MCKINYICVIDLEPTSKTLWSPFAGIARRPHRRGAGGAPAFDAEGLEGREDLWQQLSKSVEQVS